VSERHRPRIGINPTSIGVSPRWWLRTAAWLEQAGFDGIYLWDHFLSRGDPRRAVIECWTTLAGAATVTERAIIGSFVSNVMNRHPSVLARMAANVASLAPGRLDVGIGIGGFPEEMAMLGIDFPPAAERAERLEEAVAILRALWTGGPVTYEGRWTTLTEAVAYPIPDPAPRIVIAGETLAGARLAARIGDAWTTGERELPRALPVFQEALEAAGRRREDVRVIVAVDLLPLEQADVDPLLADMVGAAQAWHEAGADEIVLQWVRRDRIGEVLAAAERAGLA
jgi:alkanesulfonate monooxygenase SsuD/methylene tetrahydromethanopterin reductase-like flavin-dependent oxidoreductase (luciferase family)